MAGKLRDPIPRPRMGDPCQALGCPNRHGSQSSHGAIQLTANRFGITWKLLCQSCAFAEVKWMRERWQGALKATRKKQLRGQLDLFA